MFNFYSNSMSYGLRSGSHTIWRATVHLVRVTKYRYPILQWELQKRLREIVIQVADTNDIRILKWAVSKDHVHVHLEYPPKLSISDIAKRMKWRASRRIQDEFPELRKKYWWKHLRAIWYWYWTTGKLTEEMINEYIEHHRERPNSDMGNIILE